MPQLSSGTPASEQMRRGRERRSDCFSVSIHLSYHITSEKASKFRKSSCSFPMIAKCRSKIAVFGRILKESHREHAFHCRMIEMIACISNCYFTKWYVHYVYALWKFQEILIVLRLVSSCWLCYNNDTAIYSGDTVPCFRKDTAYAGDKESL